MSPKPNHISPYHQLCWKLNLLKFTLERKKEKTADLACHCMPPVSYTELFGNQSSYTSNKPGLIQWWGICIAGWWELVHKLKWLCRSLNLWFPQVCRWQLVMKPHSAIMFSVFKKFKTASLTRHSNTINYTINTVTLNLGLIKIMGIRPGSHLLPLIRSTFLVSYPSPLKKVSLAASLAHKVIKFSLIWTLEEEEAPDSPTLQNECFISCPQFFSAAWEKRTSLQYVSPRPSRASGTLSHQWRGSIPACAPWGWHVIPGKPNMHVDILLHDDVFSL